MCLQRHLVKATCTKWPSSKALKGIRQRWRNHHGRIVQWRFDIDNQAIWMQGVRFLQSMVSGMNLDKDELSMSFYKGSVQVKQQRAPFSRNKGTCAPKRFEIEHSDVCGPIGTTSMDGARSFVTFIDDFSRRVWLYTLKTKGECLEKFRTSWHLFNAIKAQDQGVWVRQWRGVHLQGLPRLHEEAWHPSTPHTTRRRSCRVSQLHRCRDSKEHASCSTWQQLKLSFWAKAVANAVYICN